MNWYVVSIRPNKRELFLKYLEMAISKNQLQGLFEEIVLPQEEVYKDMLLMRLSDFKAARPHLKKIENFQRIEPRPLSSEQISQMLEKKE